MTVPILKTKLHIPPVPSALVPRPRLMSRLDDGFQGRLVLVSAPAGFGKTSLLAEWAHLREDNILISWIHLDSGDNDLIQFMRYLIASLGTYQENLGDAAIAGLDAIPPVPVEALLTSLINDVDALDRQLVLVLDDYHLVDTQDIHQVLDFLLENMPAKMCLALTTRSDPPLALHRLRARGQMTEIRASDLRFNRQEAHAMLVAILKKPISTDQVDSLDRRLEGWAAGWQMVALSMQGVDDLGEFVSSFSSSHRFIMDYLAEEIYNQQPPNVQMFLLGTSILDRLSGSLCDAVLAGLAWMHEGRQEEYSAQQILESLEKSNLFLHPMDDERVWFRYHRLFANLIRQRLRQTWPEEIRGLQMRASNWFADHGYYDEAFQYALAADDYEAAITIVENQGLHMLKEGSLATILHWCERLPNDLIKERPRLNVIYAWALLLTSRQVDIEEYLVAAESIKDVAVDENELRGEIAAIRAYDASRREDIDLAREQARLALQLLPEDGYSVRSVVSFVLGGVYYLSGDMSGAYEAMREASWNGERSGNVHVAVSALNIAASILVNQGELVDAQQTYTRALELGAGRDGKPLPFTASIYGGLARLHLTQMELQKAGEYAQIGLDLGEKWFNADSQIGSLLVLAQVAKLEGAESEARAALDQARNLAASHVLTPGTAENIENVEAMIQAQLGDVTPKGFLIEQLSERELEVLYLMAEGCSNAEIAEELIVALGTVKAHSSSIYRKLDVRSRTEAVVKARNLGIV